MAQLEKFGLMGIWLGVVLLGLGLFTLFNGKLQYSNYWGGPVFAPFAVLIGVLGIYVGIVSLRRARR